jgi:hypothetical protein
MGIGALMPFARGHSEKGTIDQEPWSFGPEVCSPVSRLKHARISCASDCSLIRLPEQFLPSNINSISANITSPSTAGGGALQICY